MFPAKMFQSATLKLTGWYLLIIMLVSFMFSIMIYQSAFNQLNAQLEQFGQLLPNDLILSSSFDFQQFQIIQAEKAAHNIIMNLVYINVLIFISGGIASHLMARRTLGPIERSHESQSRFASDVSHELRTPLAVMKAELEVALRDDSLSKKEMEELLQSNLEEVNRLTKLSSTLLSLSKMDYSSLIHKKTSLTDAVDTTLKRYDLDTHKIILHKRSKKPLYVDAHQPSLEELFIILIDNAVKYSPTDSPITITLSRQRGKAIFKISNHGQGISAQDLPHIFNRFYQADNARTHSESSSFGLGLSLAKKIVELHEGELSVSSAPKKETAFTVELPIFEYNNKIASILRNNSA